MESIIAVLLILRLVVLAVVSTFSVIVLALGAHILSVFHFSFRFAGLAVAVSAVTLVTLISMLVLSIFYRGMWANLVLVEVSSLSILWVLWLAVGGLTADKTVIICGAEATMRGATPFDCNEQMALEAFAWLNWLILLTFTLFIIALGIIQHLRGNYIWMVPIYEIDFIAFRPGSPGVTYEKPVVYTCQQEQQLYAQQPALKQPVQMRYPDGAYQSPMPANTAYRSA